MHVLEWLGGWVAGWANRTYCFADSLLKFKPYKPFGQPVSTVTKGEHEGRTKRDFSLLFICKHGATDGDSFTFFEPAMCRYRFWDFLRYLVARLRSEMHTEGHQEQGRQQRGQRGRCTTKGSRREHDSTALVSIPNMLKAVERYLYPSNDCWESTVGRHN